MYEVLVTLAHLLAPFTPFIADEMYRNLANGQIRNRFTSAGGLCPKPSTSILSSWLTWRWLSAW